MFEEVPYHVRSNEIAENVDERGKHCFEGVAHRVCPVVIDGDGDVRLDAVGVDETKIPERGPLGVHARERACQQRVASVVADRTPEIPRCARIHASECAAEGRRRRFGGHLALEELASQRPCRC